MDQKEFTSEATGTIVDAETPYFKPHEFPFTIDIDEELMAKVENASTALGNLRGVGEHLDNPEFMIQPYLRLEALSSTRIEGTQSSLSEVFKEEKELAETSEGGKEVRNYRHALEQGLSNVDEPIDTNLIKQLHTILLQDVRGEGKKPGSFKTELNWIGGRNPDEARFVPCHPEHVAALLENLCAYLERTASSSFLKAAVSHYQFEAIHPFEDGNGRIGRLLILLYLHRCGLMNEPLLFLSEYFEKHKSLYIKRMFDVSARGALKPWIAFFLDAVKEQAEASAMRIRKLDQYKRECRERLRADYQTTNVLKVLTYLFSNPYTTVNDVKDHLSKPYATAKRQIEILVDEGILEEITGQQRNKQFVAARILHILSPDM